MQHSFLNVVFVILHYTEVLKCRLYNRGTYYLYFHLALLTWYICHVASHI
jgi:hypothetical protein